MQHQLEQLLAPASTAQAGGSACETWRTNSHVYVMWIRPTWRSEQLWEDAHKHYTVKTVLYREARVRVFSCKMTQVFVCCISIWRRILVTGHSRFVARAQASGRTDRWTECTPVGFSNAFPERPRDAMKLLSKASLPMTSVTEWLCKWNYYQITQCYRPGNHLLDVSICSIKFSMVKGCHWGFSFRKLSIKRLISGRINIPTN
jgi:hypothetical protein